ncbi:hypothetical protein PF010_g14217 [Phytophthora fragariae]|uniref:Arrestin-like N-terminal domain-containing protein n=1 Tax=Phytophthora fragariae TaxID=53985 RepID=A0A6G0KXI2_9STRA|nr:hypothetical protein PF010_g14217 [Phytophthora fragariae]
MTTELGVCEHRDIGVKLNRRRYVTGGLLRGRVLFRTTKFVKSSDFVVRLEGREHISWLEQSSTTRTSRTRPRRRHNKDVLQERVLLTDGPTTYRPGEYEFPFSFRLPASLPSSFQMKDRQLVELGSMESSITYKARATIRIDGAVRPYIEDSRPFIVQRPPPDYITRPLQRSSSDKIRVFRVFSCGMCTLSASLDHNEVSAGDTVTVFTSVKNQTSKDMAGISVQLIEDLEIYGRITTFNGVYALMYSWYFPKDSPISGLGHHHDWEHVVVWVNDITLDSPSIIAVSPSALSGYNIYYPPESNTIDGFSAKVDYSSSWLVVNHALDSTSDAGETQDLIMWDQLTDAARTALENTDFGDANVPMKDANFEAKLANAYYS